MSDDLSDDLNYYARVLKAADDYLSKEYSSIQEASAAYGVAPLTVEHRVLGRKGRDEVHSRSHKLEEREENLLVEWILSRDGEGYMTRRSEVEEMVRQMLATRDIAPSVGKDWVFNLANRRPELRAAKAFICGKGRDAWLSHIKSWLILLMRDIKSGKILRQHIYKVTTSGFQFGIIGKVRHKSGQLSLELKKDEWVSIIECVNSKGDAMQPFVMLKTRLIIQEVQKKLSRPWSVQTCPSQWSKSMIELEWLKTQLVPSFAELEKTKCKALLLEGPPDRLSDEFVKICKTNQIRIIYLPDDKLRLCHHLDLTLTLPLKTFYDNRASQIADIRSIDDVLEFIDDYDEARSKALDRATIRRKFGLSGVWPWKNHKDIIAALEKMESTQIDGSREDSEDGGL